MTPHTGDDSIGETIDGRYRIIKLRGSGGLGIVYKALDTRLRRVVALKVLSSAFDVESKQRFVTEARIAHSLNHPNIVCAFDVGEADGVAYVTAPYIEGNNLQEF